MYYALVALSIYALVVMRKRRIPISPMIAIVVMVTITAAISIGITRYRVGADVMLAVLGGVGLDALWRRSPGPHAGATMRPDAGAGDSRARGAVHRVVADRHRRRVATATDWRRR